jgi:glycosyltransferase involved in cell wall biosynthesis
MAGPTVVHLINSLRRGGSEGQAVQLVRLLHERGYDVTLACLDGDGPLRHELGDDPPDILEYPLTSLHDLRAARQLRRFAADLRRREVDIVHTHDVYSNIFGLPAARLARVPVRIGSRRDTGGVGTTSRRRLEGFLYRLADRVVTNADAVGRHLAGEGVPAEKIVTIHNAVDLTRVDPKLGRAEALAAFGLPPDRPLVVLVANLSHDVKDHPTFLRAARRIKDAVPASAFAIAGRGPLGTHMEAIAARLGIGDDVFFIGPCQEIGDLLALAKVCVLSSRAEGLSNAVLEYMAAARPVVATDVGGIREAVLDGETGYLVPAGDDVRMADRVIALLDDPEAAAAMGARGRGRVEAHFSSALLVERTVRLYEEALNGSAR